MTALQDFVGRIPNFASKSHSDKIQLFGWYLHEVEGKERFSPLDLGQCYDETHSSKPANIHALLTALCDRKPARLLKDTKGYRLAIATRDDLKRTLGVRSSSATTTALLASLIPRVNDPVQRVFLEEALICFNNGAYRAAVVMAWNLAYAHLCDRVLAIPTYANDFNTQKVKAFSKRPNVTKRADFEDYKESEVIEICRGARIVDTSVHKILNEKLGKRNTAAHPSSVVVTAVTAEEVIVDLVENVVLNTSI